MGAFQMKVQVTRDDNRVCVSQGVIENFCQLLEKRHCDGASPINEENEVRQSTGGQSEENALEGGWRDSRTDAGEANISRSENDKASVIG